MSTQHNRGQAKIPMNWNGKSLSINLKAMPGVNIDELTLSPSIVYLVRTRRLGDDWTP